MASRHAFALRKEFFFFPLYIPHYRESLAFCHFRCHLWHWFSSRNSYLIRATNGLPSSIPWIIIGHLGGSYRPEAHMSIRYDTAPDCHNRASLPFWLMRNSTCFRMLQVTTPADLHLSVLHMSFSLAVWNCQVQFCTSLSSKLCTNPLSEMHIRVETF